MKTEDLTLLQRQFHESDIEQRQRLLDALVDVFRPSDYRHLAQRLYPDRFVGDLLTHLPAELVDKIFSHLEPQDFYRLRSVSSLWHAYLSRSEFLLNMQHHFFDRDESYAVEPDYSNPQMTTFEQRVKNRCALLNGRAQSFDLLRHAPGSTSRLSYHAGVLADHIDSRIYVKNLFHPSRDWSPLYGDDLESFQIVQVTGRFIMACTHTSLVYVWNAETLDRIVKFRLPASPFEAEASDDTIVLFCPGSWYFHHIPTGALHRHEISADPEDIYTHMGHVESSGHIYTVNVNGTITTYRITYDPGFMLKYISTINVNTLLRDEEIETDADVEAYPHRNERQTNIVVVWNHGSLYASPLLETGSPTRIYELRRGEIAYQYTMESDHFRPAEFIFFPSLKRGFDLVCEHANGMPLGLFQVYRDSWRPVTARHIGQSQGVTRLKSDGPRRRRNSLMEVESVVADASWALSIEDAECLWSGDANFLISSHLSAGFTRVWRFYETEDDEKIRG